MESTDKLRKFADQWAPTRSGYGPKEQMLDIADEIEQEIAERYIELPVDADGVPVKLGDTIGEVDNCEFYTFTVKGYTSSLPDGEGELLLVDEHDDCWHPKNCRHVKPRTVEDVLRDMLNAYDRHEDGDMPYSFIAEYADELRNMGVGE